ncbi:MAG: exodeoxyribonuclease VII large subunit [Terriglobales bacterium]
MGEQAPLLFPPERAVWTVSGLAARLKQALDRDFFDVWVEGEISNLHRSAAQHQYFTLKDAGAQLRVALFATQGRLLRFRLQDGMQVLVRGRISLYEARGDLQCYAEHVEPRGAGGLQAAFEQLKAKLAAEGLFAAARKRPLPLLPRRVGLITSPRGAAVADMIRILRRRYPNLGILLYPVAVQGEAAAGELRAAARYFAAAPPAHRVDVLIIGRGGGSLEDLWAFNDEELARTLAASPVPVISAVGHETDFTIADFVADLRAPTPSAAAELVVRPKQDWLNDWGETRRRLAQALRFGLSRRRHQLIELTQHRAFPGARHRVMQRAQRLDDVTFRLRETARQRPAAAWRRLEHLAARIRHFDARRRLDLRRGEVAGKRERIAAAYRYRLGERRARFERLEGFLSERNPLAILSRGYALVYDGNRRLVTAPGQVELGEALRVRLAGGWLDAQATGREPGAAAAPRNREG